MHEGRANRREKITEWRKRKEMAEGRHSFIRGRGGEETEQIKISHKERKSGKGDSEERVEEGRIKE